MNMEHQLYIKSSNSLNDLSEALAIRTGRHEAGIFQPFYVVTQTDGMSSWLKMAIAEKAGIAANLIFLKPNELINKLYYASGGEWERTLSSSDIQWLIYRELGSDAIKNEYPMLRNYYEPGGRADDTKRIALAHELADLFDQYQVYRPDMLAQWSSDKLATREPEERWQKDLWRRIQQHTPAALPDKAKVKNTIIQKLQDSQNVERLREQFPSISFFGTSLLTAFHHEILWAVSEFLPVYFYLPNPAPDLYWYEDKSAKELFYQRRKGHVIEQEAALANPLLLNWGKLIQNTFLLFFSNEETINLYEGDKNLNESSTLLSSLQNLVCKNEGAAGTEFSEAQLNDGSITIQSCFSPVREVETLYNFLVRLIDEHPGKYAARDIVVHVTDINKYASFIRAVFDNAPKRLRYSIADEAWTASDSISQALYEILTLDESNFTSESVMQLLNFSSVRKHFGITDVTAIRQLVDEANIRHGIDGSLADESLYVSWEYGLRRIMYGICIHGGEEYGSGAESFFPLNDIEGSGADEAIHFVAMVRQLIALLKKREDVKTLTEWTEYIMDVLRLLVFDEEEKDNSEYQQLMEKVSEMQVDDGIFEETVPFRVFLRQFLPGLNELTQTYKFARGGITFCSLIPMRSIPFKIVAMLGLDFDKFPRKPVQAGFDLMAKHPRRGDRNIKVNDKHLFLETLLSAGDHLYLSYVGQRIQDNTQLPPSILVDELLGFIEDASAQPSLVREILVKQQPLHGFSARYGNEAGYFTYLLSANEPVVLDVEEEEEQPAGSEIDLHELYRFLCDSIGYYYKNVLGIYLDDESVTLPETEKFTLDNLEEWSLKNELLLSRDDMLDEFIDFRKKKGQIPLKNEGEYAVLNTLEGMQGVKECFDDARGEFPETNESFRIQAGSHILTATIRMIFGNKVLVPCFSKSPNKYYLRAWLYSLLLSAAGKDYQVLFTGDEIKEIESWPPAAAVRQLCDLVSLMTQGRRQMIPFSISWFLSLEDLDQRNKTQARVFDDKIKKCAETNVYLEMALGEFSGDMFEQYQAVASRVLPPLSDAIKTEVME